MICSHLDLTSNRCKLDETYCIPETCHVLLADDLAIITNAKRSLAGLPTIDYEKQDWEKLKVTEWSPAFEQAMRARLLIGKQRYGAINDPNKPQWDRIKRVMQELEGYLLDKNKERLVDSANMLLLEFEEGEGEFISRDDALHTEVR
jgi:hypothetical protein